MQRRLSFIRLTVATALAAALACAHATPDERGSSGGDAVLQLLQDNGLLPKDAQAEGQALVRQMRDAASDLVISAMNFIGVPYRRGGNGGLDGNEGFDCSGFTRHVFEHSLGLVLPRRADEQARASGLSNVLRTELKPGDLVFFNTLRHTFSHVGIYVGDGKFIHAPRSGSKVRIEDMRKAYWDRRFTGARRIDAVDAKMLPAADFDAPSRR
jgi:cell wall-associated NlpC family hydrolase